MDSIQILEILGVIAKAIITLSLIFVFWFVVCFIMSII